MGKSGDSDMGMKFTELTGDDLGVCKSNNFRLIECFKGHVVFSYAQIGNGMTAHFACDKKGLRNVKSAIKEFCKWLFDIYKWCTVIFANVFKIDKGVVRMIKKCNFKYLAEDEEHLIYARVR